MIIVTDKNCQPPKVMIVNNSTVNTAPIPYLRSQDITVTINASLDCSGLADTKYSFVKIFLQGHKFHDYFFYFRKTWEIWRAVVNSTTGIETLTLVPIEKIAPKTMASAELFLAARCSYSFDD